MAEDIKIDLDTFFGMKEVPATGRVTHVEAPAATDLLAYAEAQGFQDFKIEDWVNSAVKKGIIDEDDIDRYSSMKVWGSYTIQTEKRKGETGYYTGSPVITALKKIQRVYLALREDSILIVPEEHFPALEKQYKTNPKAKQVIKRLKNNFSFMYDRKKWKPLA